MENLCFQKQNTSKGCLMPIDYKKYHKDWKEQSKRIRFGRANNRCELCNAENYKPHPLTGKKVILTVAHLDHNWDVSKRAPDNELLALCQRCHLKIDAVFKKRKRQKEKEKNQHRMFDE